MKILALIAGLLLGSVTLGRAASLVFPITGGGGTNATLDPTNVVLVNLIATASDNVTNINERNKLYVRTNGNDSAATRGRVDKAFLTMLAARNASRPGDTIDVGPGVYNERRWATNAVNWYFQSGAVVTNLDTNGNLGGWGMIDDRGIGAITSTIAGYGTFWMGGTFPSTNLGGLLCTTNPLSRITLRGKTLMISYPGGGENAGFAAVHSAAGTNAVFVDEIIDPFYEGVPYLEDLETLYLTSGADGIYWEKGDLYVHSPTIQVGGYSYYASEPSGGTTNNCWIETDLITSYWASTIYHVGLATSSGYRSWVKAKEIRRQGSAGFATVSLYGGKVYIEAEKIGSTNNLPLILSDTALESQETWISAQKLSSPVRWLDHQSGNLYLQVMQYEDTGAVDYGLKLRGGAVRIQGGEMKVRNGHAIEHLAGTNTIEGLRIDTTGTNASHALATNNRPITIAAAGLTLQSVALISPTNGASGIFASNAQTVVIDGAASMNVSPNANVTVAGRTNTISHVRLPNVATNSIIQLGADGVARATPIGANLAVAADGTLSATAGTGIPLQDGKGTNSELALVRFLSHLNLPVVGSAGTVRMYGTNQLWVLNLTTNALLELTTPFSNVNYQLLVLKTNASVLTFSNSLGTTTPWISGFAETAGTNWTLFNFRVESSTGQTNAWLSGAENTLGAGTNMLATTNGNIITFSAVPGGAGSMLQVNMNGAFVGSTNITGDVTNGRLGFALGTTRPNTLIEMGGAGTVGTQIRAGGGSGKTNLFDSDGMGMLNNVAIKFYIGGGAAWYIDPSGTRYAFHPSSPGIADVGTFTDYIGTNWSGVTLSTAYGTRSSQLLGVGSGGTNFLPTADAGFRYIDGRSNVHIAAITGTAAGLVMWPKLCITNWSASSVGLSFSYLTNMISFSGVYGTNAPNSVTNGTRLDLAFECDGTNTTCVYAYFPRRP